MERLQTMTLQDFINENENYAKGMYYGTEFYPYKLDVITHFITDIRPTYTYVEEWSEGNWDKLDLHRFHAKFGTNYIYVDHKRKLWRTTQTASEYYGY